MHRPCLVCMCCSSTTLRMEHTSKPNATRYRIPSPVCAVLVSRCTCLKNRSMNHYCSVYCTTRTTHRQRTEVQQRPPTYIIVLLLSTASKPNIQMHELCRKINSSLLFGCTFPFPLRWLSRPPTTCTHKRLLLLYCTVHQGSSYRECTHSYTPRSLKTKMKDNGRMYLPSSVYSRTQQELQYSSTELVVAIIRLEPSATTSRALESRALQPLCDYY